MRRRALRVALGALLLAGFACKTGSPAFAHLESAVVNDRYAGSPTAANVRVVRGAEVVSPSVAMRLLKGDSITTSRTTRAVVTFAAGYEVSLDTSTAIYIENPSIFLRIGQAFIRKLLGTHTAADTARLDTHTPQATLHDAGTEYLVSVGGQGTDVRVVSGAVDASSRDGRWAGVRYSAHQQGRITPQGQRITMQPLTDRELDAQLVWVRRIEAITKVAVPSVDGMTENAARATLGRAGFSVLFVLHRETDAVAPGLVVDQSPSAGQLSAPGTYVTLTLSKAVRKATCTVPNIVRKSEPEAKRLLEAAKLRGEVVGRDRTGRTVVSQEIKEGSRVDCGTAVRYTVGTVVE
ncbi:MAG TPA: PASTA domain-containing protein [Gemmatimonadaceae bacterium]|nr:PASTA domain-containing protein [Gemmatimonadaceae bacterium]